LAILKELAHNLHWSWNHDTIELFRQLDPDLWNDTYHNPVRMLGTVRQEKLVLAARDEGFLAQLRRAYHELHDYLSGQTWFSTRYGANATTRIAYFSMEFGLTECLPIYSGGLGILAGDHLKSASELGIPLVGVGLLYQQGYFRQYLNADGWQQETYPDNDFYNLPIQLETDDAGKPVLVSVDFPERKVALRIWRVNVGRVPLYLLDTNTPENQPRDRKITYQLYGGDEETRIQQEIVLGIGGLRALRALGIEAAVCHMNEGHAAFLALERIRHAMGRDGLTFEEAFELVRAGTVFTTHTPVPAGIDIFDPQLVEKYFHGFYEQLGLSRDEFIGYGRWNSKNPYEQFNMALLRFGPPAGANGVSRLHGEVSRRMWQSNWPNVPLSEVPIESITNGIHTRSWISQEMSALLSRYLGPNWLRKPGDQTVWKNVERIPDVELWRIHERRRERLVAFTRARLADQLRRRGTNAKEIETAFETLGPETLTIGFARRFATYKRATLLLRDPERLKRLLLNEERPVQFVFAGKAHPRDNQGKELIKQLVHFGRQEGVRRRFVFLEDYDMSVARYLVQGVDVWLNTPQRPLEASGTSGMKVVPNGGLNLSVLDGWWVEGYETETGWAVGAGEEYNEPAYRDEVESKSLFDVLENEVVPLFYDIGSGDLPRKWIARVKSSMTRLAPVFNTNRMVREYTERFYVRAWEGWDALSADGHAKAREVARWKQWIRAHWDHVKIVRASIEREEIQAGTTLRVEAEVDLGQLRQEDVVVQVYSGPLDSDYNITEGSARTMRCVEQGKNGVCRYSGFIPCDESGLFGYLVRVMPHHPDLNGHFGLEMMRWIGEGEKNAVPQTA